MVVFGGLRDGLVEGRNVASVADGERILRAASDAQRVAAADPEPLDDVGAELGDDGHRETAPLWRLVKDVSGAGAAGWGGTAATARTAADSERLNGQTAGDIVATTGRTAEEVVDAIEGVKTGRKGFNDDVPLEDVVIHKAVVV